MCNKHFENRLTNKESSGQKHFWIGSFCTKISWKGGKYFPAKYLNSNYLIMIAQNYSKLTQMTYMRQNLHDQVKIVEKHSFSRSSMISLSNAKSICKIHFGHKTLFVHRFSKFLQVLLGQTKIKILT